MYDTLCSVQWAVLFIAKMEIKRIWLPKSEMRIRQLKAFTCNLLLLIEITSELQIIQYWEHKDPIQNENVKLN